MRVPEDKNRRVLVLDDGATEIRKAADRAATLTRQLLAYGRKHILQPEILDLNSVLAGIESALRHLTGPGTDGRIAPAAGLKAVKADTGQIEQVIMNMAINAHEDSSHVRLQRGCQRPSRPVGPRRGAPAKTFHAVLAGAQVAGSAGSTEPSETGPRAENSGMHEHLQ